jgi:hypothetical protein
MTEDAPRKASAGTKASTATPSAGSTPPMSTALFAACRSRSDGRLRHEQHARGTQWSEKKLRLRPACGVDVPAVPAALQRVASATVDPPEGHRHMGFCRPQVEDPPGTPEELEIVVTRAGDRLPAHFGLVPAAACTVRRDAPARPAEVWPPSPRTTPVGTAMFAGGIVGSRSTTALNRGEDPWSTRRAATAPARGVRVARSPPRAGESPTTTAGSSGRDRHRPHRRRRDARFVRCSDTARFPSPHRMDGACSGSRVRANSAPAHG